MQQQPATFDVAPSADEVTVIDLRTPRRPFDSVAIVGLGYVGLPTALALATQGVRVLGLDASRNRLAAIADGEVDLVPDDHARLASLRGTDRFVLSEDTNRVGEADAVIICVPTPVDEHLVPDLTALRNACADVVLGARRGQTVVLTSTSYVGTTRDLLVKPLAAKGLLAGTDVAVGFSPERIDPANTTFPQEAVPRVVGGVTPSCTDRVSDLIGMVAPTVKRVSSPETAEMTKLVENTFRAVNCALANEFADIGNVLGLDVREVIDAAATKPFGFMPFYPGPGVGGHCIPCDPHYLLWQLRSERTTAPVINEAMNAIAMRPRRTVERLAEVLHTTGVPLAGASVLIVGMAYKPGVEDVRESPALCIADGLAARGADVSYWDPLVASVRLPNGNPLRSVDPRDEVYDAVLLHTVHPGMDLTWLERQPTVVDATYAQAGVPQRVLL